MSINCMITVWLQQPGIALPTSLATGQVAGVSYPTPRAASAVQQLQPVQQQQSATAQKQHRVFTGVITKLHDNFGFIDEDVFFQTRWCQYFLECFLQYRNCQMCGSDASTMKVEHEIKSNIPWVKKHPHSLFVITFANVDRFL